MTNEQARQILSGLYALNIDGDADYCEKRNNAIDLAIDALINTDDKRFTIFKCPHFEQCFKPLIRTYYDNEPTETAEAVKCKAPFLEHHGNHLCKLTLEKDKLTEYPNNIKGVAIHNSINGRINEFIYKLLGE